MPDIPVAVIITGPPCTGKRILGQRLATDLQLPFLTKDRIKEILFETLGWSDRAWSKQLGAATMELLFMQIDTQLAANCSFLVECNFHADPATTHFLRLKHTYPFITCQILCHTENPILLERLRTRTESGHRHPGHVDHLNYEEISSSILDGRYAPLAIGGTILQLDTTDFTQIDYPTLLATVQTTLQFPNPTTPS